MVTYNPDVFDKDCPSRQVLNMLADKWTALVICSLDEGTKRHNEIKKQIGGISQKMLTQTLKKLEKDGLVLRKTYPVIPPKVEYCLTPLGKSLLGPMNTVCNWVEKSLPEIKKSRNWKPGDVWKY